MHIYGGGHYSAYQIERLYRKTCFSGKQLCLEQALAKYYILSKSNKHLLSYPLSGFYIFKGLKKIKRIFCDMWKLHAIPILLPWVGFYWNTAGLLGSYLQLFSHLKTELNSWNKTIWPTKSKIFTTWPLTVKADAGLVHSFPCCLAGNSSFLLPLNYFIAL